MRCKSREQCYRSVLLTITTSACISITIFIFLQFTSDRERNIKREISNESSFHSEKLTDEKCIPVCNSRNCIKQAEILLRTINPSYEPCENFQKFLCGTYEQNIGLHENGSIMLDMTLRMRNLLKSIIENIEAEPGSAAEKMKIMYNSCVNSGSSDLRGFEDFREFLDSAEIYNWPYLDADFKFSEFGLSKMLGTFRSVNEIKYFSLQIAHMNEDRNSNETFVKIWFHYDLMFNDTSEIQRDAATDILSYFDNEDVVETLLNDYYDVRHALLSFKEEFIMYATVICEENCSDTWIDCSKTHNNEWGYVCETVKIFLNILNLKQYVSKKEIAIPVYAYHYAKNLFPRLKSLPDRSVANYFALNAFWNHLDEMNLFFRRKTQKYFNYFKTEKKEYPPSSNRWLYCVNWIINYMKIVLENELMKSYLNRTYVDELYDFHQSFNSAINKMIDEQQWLPMIPKFMMMQQIESLESNVVFLQRLPNDTYVNKLLKMFNPKKTSFFHNVVNFWRSLFHAYSIEEQYMHDRYNEPNFEPGAATDKESFIVVHYGILMSPIYYPGHEKFINSIHLAPVIVHEIGHIIIFLLDMISERSSSTKEIYFERKRCIENQFSEFKFQILDENLNGSQYWRENLSDNLGYAVADKMIDETNSSEDAFLLPGLPYTLKQLLHMSSRLVFCSKVTREVEIHYQVNDVHPPPEYRLLSSAQNSKGHSEAFSCPEGSYMNPAEKCYLFDSP